MIITPSLINYINFSFKLMYPLLKLPSETKRNIISPVELNHTVTYDILL